MTLNFKLPVIKLPVIKRPVIGFFAAASIALFCAAPAAAAETDLSRGKYLVEIGGCNDCHTAGFAPAGGTTPEAQWLLGDSLGFRGGWGTTYPINLRTYMEAISENEWATRASTLRTRPPMPWWALNAMTEKDLRALYRYIKSLGVIDNPVPAYVPPGIEPRTPYIQWPLPPE